jgi:hypothetical protein
VPLLAHFVASPGVTVSITYAAHDGWAATAEHGSLIGARCGLLSGNAPVGNADPADKSGVVECGSF